MNDDYLQSIWHKLDETIAHECLIEIYKKQGFKVKDFHKHDRINENGIDLVCKKKDIELGIAVKKKPKQKDIKQLQKLSKNPVKTKIYIYLEPPTSPFEIEMEKTNNVIFWDWNKVHEELVNYESRKYLLLYFSAHPLMKNLYNIYKMLYDCHDVKNINHEPNEDEIKAIWNLKDDSVKLKATLDFSKDKWHNILMSKTEFNPDEYHQILTDIHEELNNINSKFGEVLNTSIQNMKRKYPYLLGHYWHLVSQRTNWKNFTSTSRIIGKKDPKRLSEYVLFSWILPNPENGKYSYVMRGFYSVLYYIIENTYEISKDIEDGVDWLHSSILFEQDA